MGRARRRIVRDNSKKQKFLPRLMNIHGGVFCQKITSTSIGSQEVPASSLQANLRRLYYSSKITLEAIKAKLKKLREGLS